MAFVREFEWREDEEYGGEGWALKGVPHFNVMTGVGIAHDTLEHFPGKYHTLEDEMLALGAILYMRAEGGWFYNRGSMLSPAENLASDVFHFVVRDHNLNVRARKTRRLDPESEAEYVIADIVKHTMKLWESECDEEDREYYPRADTLAAVERAMDWIRTGYRKAVKRWGRFPEHWAHFFKELADEVDRKHKRGEFGEVLRVSVNISQSEYKITRVWQDEEY